MTLEEKAEVVSSYRNARNRAEQIDILSHLYEVDVDTIIEILENYNALDLRDLKKFKRCKICNCFIKSNARQGKCLNCRRNENRRIRTARIAANRGGGRGHKKVRGKHDE